MLFNSFEFLVFLLIVFLVYWKLNRKSQNIFLLLASYVFYGWWDWRFLSLILISSLADFLLGQKIYQSEEKNKRKLYLFLSVLVNIGILGFFKYFGFFVTSMQSLLTTLGIPELSLTTLNIILPIGISFYTFQTMSYSIEIYQRKIKPTNNLVEFFAFVAFFPQLVAGPIERASNLLHQFAKDRIFKYQQALDGCRQMLWGFFKKIVIADNIAMVVNEIYGGLYESTGNQLLMATILFAFQIYCDFSGYSDIAIGAARLFGFNLKRNFAYPYFSRNIAEFWRRWHISLSTWFRDYVFIPLGGSRVKTKFRYLINILITFTLSGLWHGANWTFIVWGFLNGLYYIPYIFSKRARSKHKQLDSVPQFKHAPQIAITFVFVLFAWIFFRSQSLNEALYIIEKIVRDLPNFAIYYKKGFAMIGGLVIIEWIQRKYAHPLHLEKVPVLVRRLIYLALILMIIFWGEYHYHPFIYFQF